MTCVILKGGVSVALEALSLAWALEHRGYTFRVDGDILIVGGAPLKDLTEEDRDAVRQWKPELMRIAAYEVPEGTVPA